MKTDISIRFAKLLYQSSLNPEAKQTLLERLSSLSSDQLETLYTLLQEEDQRKQKKILEADVRIQKTVRHMQDF